MARPTVSTRYQRDCAELYQVIGTLREAHGDLSEHPAVLKALDNASAAACGEPRPHHDLLPFVVPLDTPGIVSAPGAHITGPALPPEEIARGREWRVGRHYGIHLYADDVPLGTMLTPALAAQVVADHNALLSAAEEREAANAENARLREALEIIAGKRQCLDNLMSNQEVARAALAPASNAQQPAAQTQEATK